MSFLPHTPQSPSQSSPAGMTESLISATPNPVAVAAISNSVTLPTPAHSVSGSTSQQLDMAPDSAMNVAFSPPKRKRSLDDNGDQAAKKAYINDRKLGIEDLHLDVGTKYLLCGTAHPPSLPRTSDDLFALFGLEDLAIEVAREKSNGEKNAMRKSYKGHIKKLGVVGHFDAVKKEMHDSDCFMAMLQPPEEEWNALNVSGRDIMDGLSDATLASLSRAMTMARGPILKSVWDSSVLGDLAPPTVEANVKPSGAITPSHTAPITASRPKPLGPEICIQPRVQQKLQLPQCALDPTRPKRNLKKRGYADSNFEGYGEGYPDDDAVIDGGYSTGDADDRGGAKRRKKNLASSTPPFTGAIRQPSYGPGMVGA